MKPKTNGILAGAAALLLFSGPLPAVPTSSSNSAGGSVEHSVLSVEGEGARPAPQHSTLNTEHSPANAQRFATRCQSIRTLTARLSGEATWQGQPLSTRVDLTFARGDAGSGGDRPRLRLE